MAATANKRTPHRAGLLSACVALAFAPGAHALDWKIEPSIETYATYTDNARQSAVNPDDALILGVMPGFVLRSEGSRRVEATLQYGMRGVFRFGDDRDDVMQHNLNALGKAELIEDFLFVDGSARVSQELISLIGSPAGADVNDSNRADVASYSISPYIKKRLGTFAQTELRYTASGTSYGENAVSDAHSNGFSAVLASGTRFDDLNWSLNYSIRDNVNRDDVDTRFESASVTLGYALSRKFRLIGSYGHDWNDYPVPPGTETEGPSYSAGFAWAPTRRTSLELSAGENYLGSTYNVAARHRTRTTNWNLSYTQGLSDASQFSPTNGTQYDYRCPTADGGVKQYNDWKFTFPPEPGCIAFGGRPGVVFDLRSGVFFAKTLRSGVSWGINKFTYTLNYTDSRRLFTASGEEDRTTALGLLAVYRVSPLTSLNAGLTFTHIQLPVSLNSPARDDDWTAFSLGVDHRFAEKLSGALIFRRNERDSNVATGDYTENSLTASVNMRF
ncbi:MAG: TIGR03016 family PEP-CTERM system-associated outer membrane protein [Pseudomonadota bacterium]